jgi:hypothetical protein
VRVGLDGDGIVGVGLAVELADAECGGEHGDSERLLWVGSIALADSASSNSVLDAATFDRESTETEVVYTSADGVVVRLVWAENDDVTIGFEESGQSESATCTIVNSTVACTL